jgi:hypothetical protein
VDYHYGDSPNEAMFVVYHTPVRPGVSRSFFKAMSKPAPRALRVLGGLALPPWLTGAAGLSVCLPSGD